MIRFTWWEDEDSVLASHKIKHNALCNDNLQQEVLTKKSIDKLCRKNSLGLRFVPTTPMDGPSRRCFSRLKICKEINSYITSTYKKQKSNLHVIRFFFFLS